MSEVIKQSKATGVSLILHDDGRYQVVDAAGEVLVETRVEGYAQIVYQEAVDERDTAKERRERERAHYDLQAVRSDSFARRAANSRKKGGKGGRGGV